MIIIMSSVITFLFKQSKVFQLQNNPTNQIIKKNLEHADV